jgi:sec-independent protein translocase protein TatC
LMAGPMFLLYWVGIFGAKVFGKKTAADAKSDQPSVPTAAMAGSGVGGTVAGVAMPNSSRGEDYVGVPGGRPR